MPSRVIRGEINASRSLERVSMLADLTFRALLVVVDDFGRFDARLSLLRAALFPTRGEVTDDRLQGWLAELEAEGCVKRYQVRGEEYLYLPAWERHRSGGRRAECSRYPDPPSQEILGNPVQSSDFPSGSEKRVASSEKREAGSGGVGEEPAVRSAPRTALRSARHPFPADLNPEQTATLHAWIEDQAGEGKIGSRWRDPAVLAEAVERCRDWHRSRGKMVADPVAAVRNWLRREPIAPPAGFRTPRAAEATVREREAAQDKRTEEQIAADHAELIALVAQRRGAASPLPASPVDESERRRLLRAQAARLREVR